MMVLGDILAVLCEMFSLTRTMTMASTLSRHESSAAGGLNLGSADRLRGVRELGWDKNYISLFTNL
jgi:hypothetical protein